MKKKLIYSIVFLILFVGGGVLRYIGWTEKKFFPMRYAPYVFLLLPFIFQQGLFSSKYLKEERDLLVTFIIASIISLIIGRLGSISEIFGILLSPVLLSIALISNNSIEQKNFIRKYIFIFYILECIMAIIEKIMGINILGYNYSFDEDLFYGFRSSALHSHPLSNALLVSIIMVFILIYPCLTYWKKILLYLIGIVALLCFNTRSSIMAMTVVFMIHFAYYIISSKKNIVTKSFYISLVYSFATITSYLILYTGMGGRLIERGVMDNSANTRIEILQIYLDFSLSDLIYGVGNQEMLRIAEMNVNGGHAENYWILFAASFGLIIFIPIVILFVILYKKYFVDTNFLFVFLTAGTFLVVSSTNNSLFFQAAPLCVFMLCAYSMLPCKKESFINNPRLITNTKMKKYI